MPALNADSSRVISSSEFVCLLLRVGWSALIRLDRVDHVGIFTMNDPPGEASHGTPLINKTGEIEYTGITPIPINVKWHSFNQSSPPLSLSLASSHTFWPQSLTLPLPLLHLTSNLVAPERSYWDSGFDSAFSMREIISLLCVLWQIPLWRHLLADCTLPSAWLWFLESKIPPFITL